jgi:DNA-binding CsgD family transcriptional regulator/PAS domain-containing protein
MGISPPQAHLAPPDHGIAARASSAEFERAVGACEFAVVVWESPEGVVALANDAASTLFDTSLPELLGAKNVDLLGPRDAVEDSFATLSSRAVENLRAERHIRTPKGFTRVREWSRTVEMDQSLAAVSLYIPMGELGRLGRDPSAPWRDLAPVAIGTADVDWRVDAMSSDLRDIIGTAASDCIGATLLDLVHPDDAPYLVDRRNTNHNVPRSHCHVRFRHRNGWWTDVCVLVAPLTQDRPDRVAFALLGLPHLPAGATAGRVAELELRLRHIGTEVRAAGVLDELDAMPATSDHPQLSELTGRQWEILSRLIRGERVPTIARELFISQSTVRNHLGSIYARFDVHSQAELLEVLRRPPLAVQHHQADRGGSAR